MSTGARYGPLAALDGRHFIALAFSSSACQQSCARRGPTGAARSACLESFHAGDSLPGYTCCATTARRARSEAAAPGAPLPRRKFGQTKRVCGLGRTTPSISMSTFSL
jgi:hypothetical protein